MNLNRTRPRPVIRPLASIPQKEGAVIIGVRADGSESALIVHLDGDQNYTVSDYHQLIGWKLP